MLEALEVGQYVLVAPAQVSGRRPAVVVLALAAYADQPIDRAGAAERLASRPVDAPSVHARLRLGLETPVHTRVEHRLGIADRHVNPRVAVRRPGFEQQHLVAAVSGKPVGQHAAGGTRPDDDVVIAHGRILAGTPGCLATQYSMGKAPDLPRFDTQER